MSHQIIPDNQNTSSSSVDSDEALSRGSSYGQTQAENRWPEYLEPPIQLPQQFSTPTAGRSSHYRSLPLLEDAQQTHVSSLGNAADSGQRHETPLAVKLEETSSAEDRLRDSQQSPMGATWGSHASLGYSPVAAHDPSSVKSRSSPGESQEEWHSSYLEVNSNWTLSYDDSSSDSEDDHDPSIGPSQVIQPHSPPQRSRTAPPPFKLGSPFNPVTPSPRTSGIRSSRFSPALAGTESQERESPLGYGQSSDQSYRLSQEHKTEEGATVPTDHALDHGELRGADASAFVGIARGLGQPAVRSLSPSADWSYGGVSRHQRPLPAVRDASDQADAPVSIKSEPSTPVVPLSRLRTPSNVRTPTPETLAEIADSVTTLRQRGDEMFDDNRERLTAIESLLTTIVEEQARHREQQERQTQELARNGRTLDNILERLGRGRKRGASELRSEEDDDDPELPPAPKKPRRSARVTARTSAQTQSQSQSQGRASRR